MRLKVSLAALLLCMVAFGEATHPTLAQGSPGPENQLLRLQEYPGTILNLPIWVAIDGGFCAKAGLRCERSTIPSGPLALQALASGSVEVIWTAADVSMVAASRGNDVQAIVGLAPNNIYTLSIRNDKSLPNEMAGYPANMKDVRGLNVGITARGASTEITLRALLSGAGISSDDVTYVAVGSPATAYPSIVAKQIDAALMFEPFRTLCEAQKTCHTLVDLGAGQGPPELQSLNGGFLVFVASRDFVTKHARAIDSFIQVMTETITWMQAPQNFDMVVKIANKHMSLGDIPGADAILVKLVRSTLPTFGVRTERSSIKAFSDFLLKYGQIQSPIDPSTFVYAKSP